MLSFREYRGLPVLKEANETNIVANIEDQIDKAVNSWYNELMKDLAAKPSDVPSKSLWDRFKKAIANVSLGKYNPSNPFYHSNLYGDVLGSQSNKKESYCAFESKPIALEQYKDLRLTINSLELALNESNGMDNLRIANILKQHANKLKDTLKNIVRTNVAVATSAPTLPAVPQTAQEEPKIATAEKPVTQPEPQSVEEPAKNEPAEDPLKPEPKRKYRSATMPAPKAKKPIDTSERVKEIKSQLQSFSTTLNTLEEKNKDLQLQGFFDKNQRLRQDIARQLQLISDHEKNTSQKLPGKVILTQLQKKLQELSSTVNNAWEEHQKNKELVIKPKKMTATETEPEETEAKISPPEATTTASYDSDDDATALGNISFDEPEDQSLPHIATPGTFEPEKSEEEAKERQVLSPQIEKPKSAPTFSNFTQKKDLEDQKQAVMDLTDDDFNSLFEKINKLKSPIKKKKLANSVTDLQNELYDAQSAKEKRVIFKKYKKLKSTIDSALSDDKMFDDDGNFTNDIESIDVDQYERNRNKDRADSDFDDNY
jgi:hypothetical protein